MKGVEIELSEEQLRLKQLEEELKDVSRGPAGKKPRPNGKVGLFQKKSMVNNKDLNINSDGTDILLSSQDSSKNGDNNQRPAIVDQTAYFQSESINKTKNLAPKTNKRSRK